MRRLSVAIMLWLVLLALVLGVLAQLVLADDCSGEHQYCGSWYDTCCARGCTDVTLGAWQWDYCYELYIQVGPMWYPGACTRYKKTAEYYNCPDGEPPCTLTKWEFEIWGECD